MAFSQPSDPLTIDQAVAIALTKNPRILTAIQEIEAADGRVMQAGRVSNPEIGFFWNETPTDFSLGQADERDIGITQEIEFPTRRWSRIGVAEHDWEISKLRLEQTKVLVSADTKKAYYEALISQKVYDGLSEQVNVLRDVQQTLSDRYQTGGGSYLDVIRAKLEVARLNNELLETGRELWTRRTHLNLLLGNSPELELALTDTLTYSPFLADKDSLVQQLTERSLTLRIAQSSIAREDEAVSLAHASYLPDFSLGLFYQWRNEEPPFNANEYYGASSEGLGLELGVSVPLWFWHDQAGQVKEAEASRTISGLNNIRLERQVRANIINAVRTMEAADAQMRVFDQSLLDDAKDIVETGIDQYRNNRLDLLNLLDIYRTATATRLEYAQAVLSYNLALAELEAAGELPLED